jgi:hypothetical protein
MSNLFVYNGREWIEIAKSGKDGKDAQEVNLNALTQKVLSLIPKPKKEKITIETVENLSQELDTIRKNIRANNTAKGGGGMGAWVHQAFSTSSATTTVTLSNNVAANSTALLVRYNGQLLAHGVQYTISGKTISFTFTLDDNSTVDCTFVRT